MGSLHSPKIFQVKIDLEQWKKCVYVLGDHTYIGWEELKEMLPAAR